MPGLPILTTQFKVTRYCGYAFTRLAFRQWPDGLPLGAFDAIFCLAVVFSARLQAFICGNFEAVHSAIIIQDWYNGILLT